MTVRPRLGCCAFSGIEAQGPARVPPASGGSRRTHVLPTLPTSQPLRLDSQRSAFSSRVVVSSRPDVHRTADLHLAVSMSDLDTTPERSALMKRVRREGTAPELAVRELLYSTGGRYRLNVDDLPGSPDIANKSRSKAIFVHGCFWHFHRGCHRASVPDRNSGYWRQKLERNRQRDHRKQELLAVRGFDVLVVWECELEDLPSLRDRLQSFWFDETRD